jgi:hypothetical protein
VIAERIETEQFVKDRICKELNGAYLIVLRGVYCREYASQRLIRG